MASAVATTWVRFSRREWHQTVWLLPASRAVADYLENAAAWVALARFPESAGIAASTIGVWSASKQALGSAAGIALILADADRDPRG